MKSVYLWAAMLLAGLAAPTTFAATPAKVPSPVAVTAALPPAQEQALASELGQCIALKSTGEDRLAAARWFAAALASAPAIRDIATIDAAKKDLADTKIAQVVTRLLTIDCVVQSKPLYKARSSAGFRAAGEVLGKLAMQELLGDPVQAQAMMGGYLSHIRPEDFSPLDK
jgi:hypothetical protein